MPTYQTLEGTEQIVLNLSEGYTEVNGLDQTTADTLYRRLDTDVPATDISGVDLPGHVGDATIHRIINDSGTSATELWSASKIDGLLAAAFQADGSVPMTGNFQLGSNDITSNDVDLTATFGQAVIGDIGYADNAALAHRDNATLTGYIVRQASTGNTILNSVTAGTTSFAIGNSIKMSLNTTTLDLKASIVSSNDADTIYTLGRATIGYDGASSDLATFAHRDSATATGFAIQQTTGGKTILNTATGTTMGIRVNDSDIMTLTATTFDLLDVAVSSTDADTVFTLGRASFGLVSAGTADSLYMAHRDHFTSGSFAIRQDATGNTYLNAATTKVLTFRINNSEIAQFNASGLDINGFVLTSDDGDTAHLLGRASIGYDGATVDSAIFSHRDHASLTNAALRQHSSGNVIINAPTGGTIDLRINDATYITANSTSFELNSLVVNSDDADTEHIFGRASIGYDGSNGDMAVFAHRDRMANAEFALLQTSLGNTYLNASGSRTILFTVNNLTKMFINTNQIDFTDMPIDSDDEDTIFTFGRGVLGYDGTNSDRAIFAHRDFATSGNAAFGQEADGDTIINAPTGQTIQMKINEADVVRVNSSGFMGIGTTSPQEFLHIEDSGIGGSAWHADAKVIVEHNGNSAIQIAAATTGFSSLYFSDSGDADAGGISYDHTNDRFVVRVGGSDLMIFDSNLMHPNFDDVVDLGHGSARFDDIYATNGAIQTSDLGDKENVLDSDLGLNFVLKLRPRSFKWKRGGGRPTKPGRGNPRKHYGLVAQEVKSAMNDLNIGNEDFAPYVESRGKLGLRYNEFIAPMLKAIQELHERIEVLEGN